MTTDQVPTGAGLILVLAMGSQVLASRLLHPELAKIDRRVRGERGTWHAFS